MIGNAGGRASDDAIPPPLLPDGITVPGYIYDVNTGAQTVVAAEGQGAAERSAMAASTRTGGGTATLPGGPAPNP